MVIISIMLGACIFAFLSGMYLGKSKKISFGLRHDEYSIGIYQGESPLKLFASPGAVNPVIRASDVTDVEAAYVADPFMINENGLFYMFFEVLNSTRLKGEIGLATSSDGLRWQYEKIVLREQDHMSYPYVFKYSENYYMIPETCKIYGVYLYRAVEFPTRWEQVAKILTGNYFDSSIVRYENKWWLFTSDRDDILRLFFSEDLLGPWIEHPQSPVVRQNPVMARGAGRVVINKGTIIRYSQDCSQEYGYQVSASEIIELTKDVYIEKAIDANPILRPGDSDWNSKRMHHVDPHMMDDGRWIACVDGVGKYWNCNLLTFFKQIYRQLCPQK